jgi:CRP/FNR family transcriptional regulator, transcriptional activator FtrB
MRAAKASEIKSVPLFAGIGEEHFDALVNAALLQRFPAYAEVMEEGDKPDFLHIMVEGSVELFARIEDQRTTIAILRPITAFILAAVVADLPYPASARTLKPSRLLMIRAETVRSLFDQNSAFARAVACELSRAFGGALTELKEQKLRTCMQRLAGWLLRASAQFGESGRFTIPFDKRTLASRLGMTPENLSRNLKALSDHGVFIRGRNVILENPAALATIAQAKAAAVIDFERVFATDGRIGAE